MATRSRSGARKPIIGILGDGRVGSSFAKALRRVGHRVLVADRRPSTHPKLARARVLFLAVPDRALGDALRALDHAGALVSGQIVAHTIGAADLAPLAPIARRGAVAASLHPIAAVASRGQDLHGGYASVDGPPPARRVLAQLAREMGMRVVSAQPSDRRRYHLGASLVANAMPPLVEAGALLMSSAGVPEEEARRALVALARSALDSLERRGGPEGLTGPIVRGDVETVRAHLDVLAHAPALRGLYADLNLLAVKLARRRKPAPPHLDAIEALLRMGRAD